MGKYDDMTLQELQTELHNAKGFGTRILRKVGERNTAEAAELVFSHARSAQKAKETEAAAQLLAGMGEAGLEPLLRMLRQGNTFYDGISTVGPIVEQGGPEYVEPARKMFLEIVSELNETFADAESWLSLIGDDGVRERVREQLFEGKYSVTPEDQASLARNAAFMEKLQPDVLAEYRNYGPASAQFTTRTNSPFTIARSLWSLLSKHGSIDDELVAARDGLRHPNRHYLD